MKNALIEMLHCNKNDTEIFQYLEKHPLEDVDNQDLKNNTLLILCSSRKYIKSLTRLLEMGANPNSANIWGFTPICWAATDGLIKMVDVLIQYKADISHKDNKGHTPALIAVKNNRLEVAKFLLDKTHNLEELIYFKNKTIEIKKIEDTVQIEKGRKSFWALTEENFIELINYTNEKIEVTKK